MRKMPDFLIIGAQKARTTSLYNYLTQHEQIDAAIVKEVHYFDVNFDKPLEWYMSRFPSLDMSEKNLTGEASPYYIFHPLVPERIHNIMPDIKIIVLLRNPVNRAFSHYHHAIKNLGETLTFEEAIEIEEERLNGEKEKFFRDPLYYSSNFQHYSYLARGIYADQLKSWFNIFPREQFLILTYEDFFSRLPESMKCITDFLCIELHDFNMEPQNQGNYIEKMNPHTEKRLREYFAPHNKRLYELLEIPSIWD